MKVPFVSFLPMERELNKELRDAFDRVFTRSWYIEGAEDEAFEKAFAILHYKLLCRCWQWTGCPYARTESIECW